MKIRVLRTGRMVGTLLVSLFFAGISVKAAYLRSVPQLLQQPDGRSLSCFATGDEYYHWLHDAANFTIIKDVSSGYYVYAQKSGDQLIPTSLVAGIADPVASGLQPGINLSGEQIGQIRKNHIIYSTLKTIHKPGLAKDDPSIQGAPQTGDVNNLVVYIRFSDEIEWTDDTTTYFNKFNNTTAGYNSMRNYYDEVSYGQLDISSTFYPQPSGSTVISYQDANPRSYYQIYDASTNPGGYQDDAERTSREHTLLKNAVADIASEVPGGLDIDGDNDGFVDNVCFIVTGVPDGWSELLWPHRWALYSQTAMINGKRVWDYNFQIRSSLNSSGVGVLCHEMFHSIGAPDLYHYVDNGISPVGPWDIMENDANPPQHMSAYMKYRYGGWISDIPEITSDGDYTLNPLVSSTNNCYKIASPNSTTEYYVLEYREDTGPFESSLPNSGLLVFRINTDEDGNGNADGPPDEVYLYRPNGTTVVDGSVYQAFFSAASGRTAINDATNPDPFLSDGSAGGLDISAIGAAGATISFHVGLSGASPSADFEASATSACPGSAIDFSDLSTNTPTSWTWTFTPATVTYVGATTQNSQDPQVQFDATGTYTVQLDATNLDGTDTEIKVDYITISDAQSLPFTEGFENIVFPPNGWSITNPDADKTWERFSPTGGLGTGNGSAYVLNWDYMVSGQLDALITPPIDLSASLSATMIFYHAYRVYPGQAEELNIYISTDCGLTYLPAPLFSKSGYDLETSPDPGGGEMLQPAIISDWERDSIDLTPYVGNTVTIMFEQTSDWGNNLYLDDINIFEPAQAPQTGFIVDMTTACETEVVSFTDTTLNIPTAWTWTFTPATVSYAGATNANSQNPQVIFDAAGSYTVELVATNSGGSDAVTKTNLMTINVMAEPSITGNATVDESTSESYSTTDNSASGYTYMWVVSGGTIASGQGTADITVDWGLGGAGQVSVTETTDLGCDSTAVQSITIQGNSPHPSITGTSELCENTTGFSYSTTDNTGDGNTYVWYVSAGGTIVSGQNTPEIVVDWSAAGADTVIVTETDPLLVSENDTLFITVSTTPVADAGADQDICAGETATLVASGGSTYLWSTAETTASIDVSPADTTKYYVTVSNGCDAVDSVTVNVIEVPPPAISGNDAICESNLETYSTTDNSGIGNTYLWVVSGGTIISGQNTSDIVVDWGTMGAGYVKVTETTALAVSASDSLPVAISQGTSPDIAGTNGAYENATSVLYTTDDNSLFGATYFWEVVGGTIAGGQATPQITVDWGVAGAGEVIVTETNSGGCSNTDTVFVIIMAGSGPTPSISGPTGACLGETGVQYYTTDETASGIVYLWSVTGGTITSGQSTPTIIVTWDVADTARIILRAYDGFVFNRDTLYVIVTDQPVAEAGSDQEICEGEPA
ncbi:MAG: M6 family metalloprotease domain-containing protein, partial [Bacteroidetes bacterium]|nr:M6 family metalloprotease domain-containing protein [Bacteroidota bacterium]